MKNKKLTKSLIIWKKIFVLNGLFFFIFIFFTLYCIAPALATENLIVTPAVIDEKAKASDILKYTIELINNADKYLEIYPFVNNLRADIGKEEFLADSVADKATSLANWIEISRASIMLKEGEKITKDISIFVSPYAKPGIYHALISFPLGSNRSEAEAKVNQAQSLTINFEVLEDRVELIKLKKFISTANIFSDWPIELSLMLENTGNTSLVPGGEIIFYNNSGREEDSLKFNLEGKSLELAETSEFKVVWPSLKSDTTNIKFLQKFKNYGRYKALLRLEYGIIKKGTLEDTIFFWVIPYKKILIIFLILAVILISIILFFDRKRRRLYLKNNNKALTKKNKIPVTRKF